MKIALEDMGTIDIQDQKIVRFIQNKSIDEIKTLFLQFFTKQIETTQKQPNHKWAEFGEMMHGRISEETADTLLASSREFRDGFDFRELDSTR